jgi:hypothetical protein
MARADIAGFFWDDTPPPKPPKAEKPKRTPPERTWERPDYLPGLQEAVAFRVQQFEDWELAIAAAKGEKLVFDIECYANYFLIAFTSLSSGKVIYFERTANHDFNREKLWWLIHAFCLVSFNGINYDLPILALALAGKTNAQLKAATNEIIVNGTRPSDVLRSSKVKKLNLNHIDLIEVAPLRASLKIYGGRLHAPRMQDLPFHPETTLSPEQIAIVRWYCVNDLTNTAILHESLKEQIDLRDSMGKEYKMDLRSKSDAQIAEAVIAEEVERLNGARAQRPTIEPGTRYKYKIPSFIKYQSPLMNWALDVVRNANFIVSEDGNVGMPEELKALRLEIAGGVYRMGIGGLHSSEQCAAHYADANTLLIDRDVTSYYPYIILNQGLYPQHLGPNFLKVYRTLVERRIAAKHAGNKVIADSLKITINGSFGKLGSRYSVLYAPDLLIQVTVTGQLSLLMLIERLEMVGINVVSANTDGIVIKCPTARQEECDAIVKQWEADTSFETEDTQYLAVFSRDVNNYIAVKKKFDKATKQWLYQPDGCKTKGAYAFPEKPSDQLHKNPTNSICVEAVLALLTKGTPIMTTVRSCTDIRKFASVRTVKGGAVKDGTFLGKSIRWYYKAGEEGEIVYADSGNKVPRSEGATPMMDLPATFPQDVDYEWYEQEAERMLYDIGYAVAPADQK